MIARLVRRESRSSGFGDGFGGPGGRWFWNPLSSPLQLPFGAGWFLALVVALWLGAGALAAVMAVASGLAAGQTARSWWGAGERADVALSLLVGALAPIAAAVHTAALGAVLVAGGAVSFLAASVQARGEGVPLQDTAYTIQSWLPISLATASVVLVYRYEPGGAVWLLFLTAVYDAGHYLIGADGKWPWPGPLAGMAGVLVTAFTLTIIGVPPFDNDAALRFTLLAVLLVPLGVVYASLLLPDADARAGAMRRIDSLLVIAPVWAFLVGRHLESLA